MSNKEVEIGQESSFTKFPAEVTIERESYFLVKNDSGYQLLSTICPHSGGEVQDFGTELVCPLHYWCFDKTTGECTSIPGEGLTAYPISVREGILVALIS